MIAGATQAGQTTCVFTLRDWDVFGANDAIALGCLEALGAQGLRVPEDPSVVGFDDSLPTVRQPLNKIGRRAVEVLVEHIEAVPGKRGWQGPRSIVLPSTVVQRPTLAAPRRRALSIG